MNSTEVQKFKEEGCFMITNFLSESEVEELKEECHQLLDKMDVGQQHSTFETDKEFKDDYFMTSGDKIRYFFEADVFDDNGKLKMEKHLAINKIGHALHALNPKFKAVTFSNKIKNLCKSLEIENPVVAQSMYIFKQPYLGGAVNAHQDSTFLYTEPMKLLGIWIPLEDVTEENGCLSYIPGSHKSGLHNERRMVIDKSNPSQTKYTNDTVTYDMSKFQPIIVKKGTLVLIDGLVVHKSEKNLSSKSRHVYTFHLYDQHDCIYSTDNWLQPTKELPFPSVYDTHV